MMSVRVTRGIFVLSLSEVNDNDVKRCDMTMYYLFGFAFGILLGCLWEKLTWDEEAERKKLIEKAMRRYREATQKKR